MGSLELHPLTATPELIQRVAQSIEMAASLDSRHPYRGVTHEQLVDLLGEGVTLSLDASVTDAPSFINYKIPLQEGHNWIGACGIDDDTAQRLKALAHSENQSFDSSVPSESHGS